LINEQLLRQLSVFAKSFLQNNQLHLQINNENPEESFGLTKTGDDIIISGYTPHFTQRTKGLLDYFVATQFYQINHQINHLPHTQHYKLLKTIISWRAFKLLTTKFAGAKENILLYKYFELTNQGIDAGNNLQVAIESIFYEVRHSAALVLSTEAVNLILQFKTLHESNEGLISNEANFMQEALVFIEKLVASTKPKQGESKITKTQEATQQIQDQQSEERLDEEKDDKNNNAQTTEQQPSEDWDDDISAIAKFIEQNKLKNEDIATALPKQQVVKSKMAYKIGTDDFKYKIFTTQFDKICNIKELCTNEKEIKQIKQHFLLDLRNHKNIAKKDINKLLAKISSASKVNYIYDTEEGKIDKRKFSSVVIKKSAEAVFYKRQEIKNNDITISILVDNSGSMRGRLIKISSIACYLLANALGKINIPTEVLGFTTANWQGGESFKMYQDLENKSQTAGRVSDCLHVIYKSFSQKNSQSNLLNIALMQKDSLLKENIDGEALQWAYKRLLQQKAKRKILIVISDGTPIDDATLSLNEKTYLKNHLHAVVNGIENAKQVTLLAIGIMHNVGTFYTNATQINSVDELSSTLIKNLTEVL